MGKGKLRVFLGRGVPFGKGCSMFCIIRNYLKGLVLPLAKHRQTSPIPTSRQRSEWRVWRSRPRLARLQRTTGWRDRKTFSGGFCKSHSPADAGCWRRRTPSKPFDRAADAKKRDTWGTPRTCTPASAKRGRQTSTFTNYIWRAWSHGNSGTPLSNKPLEAFVRFMCLTILMCWLLNPCPGIATNLATPSCLATCPEACLAQFTLSHFLPSFPKNSMFSHYVPGAELPQGSLHLSRGCHQLDVAAATSSVAGCGRSNDPEVCVIKIEGLADRRFRTEVQQVESEMQQAFGIWGIWTKWNWNYQLHQSAVFTLLVSLLHPLYGASRFQWTNPLKCIQSQPKGCQHLASKDKGCPYAKWCASHQLEAMSSTKTNLGAQLGLRLIMWRDVSWLFALMHPRKQN